MLTLLLLASVLVQRPVLNNGLKGKVMCGYQGWFTAAGDGTDLPWFHYSSGREFSPGHAVVDFWPATGELPKNERYETGFKKPDGSPAYVFSSNNPATVQKHFEWMRDYGLDGVFLQRFGSDLKDARVRKFRDNVLRNVQVSAEKTGRLFSVMYDLSGLQEGETSIIENDWKRINDEMKIRQSSRYLLNGKKPVVVLWGIGFSDHRKYTLAECSHLIDFLQHDKTYGGNQVMVGVPTYWRTGDRDAVSDPQLRRVIEQADIVSPWAVGRYSDDESATRYATQTLKADVGWATGHDKIILPVVFPGFSWHNLNPQSPSNQIPRRQGAFFKNQFAQDEAAGATSIYVAMFDEINEGTAIFKLDSNPPDGFVSLESVGSDAYLKIVGEETKKLRKREGKH